MPWNTVSVMDGKMRFISDVLNGVLTFSDICQRYGISRETGYKWGHRYEEEGGGVGPGGSGARASTLSP